MGWCFSGPSSSRRLCRAPSALMLPVRLGCSCQSARHLLDSSSTKFPVFIPVLYSHCISYTVQWGKNLMQRWKLPRLLSFPCPDCGKSSVSGLQQFHRARPCCSAVLELMWDLMYILRVVLLTPFFPSVCSPPPPKGSAPSLWGYTARSQQQGAHGQACGTVSRPARCLCCKCSAQCKSLLPLSRRGWT